MAVKKPRPIKVGRNAPIRGTRSAPKPRGGSPTAKIRKKVRNVGNALLPGNPF